MTNFSNTTTLPALRAEYISRLSFPSLIIDDFEMERGTEWPVWNRSYNVIDSRWRSRKPLIVTTNLTLRISTRSDTTGWLSETEDFMLRQATQNLITAAYPRLSHEDELQGESNSISNQKGYSKPTQNRTALPICAGTPTTVFPARTSSGPDFKPCLRTLKPGKWVTVIVKDMSRLGRNYLQVGFYTEMLFPQKGVRFIAVNDNVDSANGGMDNDFTPLRNLFNEWRVRDTSKKIKGSKTVKRHERQACYQQAGLRLCDGRGRKLYH